MDRNEELAALRARLVELEAAADPPAPPTPRREAAKPRGWWLAGAVAAAALVVYFLATTAPSSPSANDAWSPAATEPGPPTPVWAYDVVIDELRGTRMSTATMVSPDLFEDTLSRNPKPSQLTLRLNGKKQEVVLTNPNLQFVCSAYSDDSVVAVKFDHGPVEQYPCSEEATSTYGVAFIHRADRFIAKLKRAKTVEIGAAVFQRGELQMRFPNPGLLWPPR